MEVIEYGYSRRIVRCFLLSSGPRNLTVRSRLIDFFKYYSRDFTYNTGVASIRAGLLKKEDKGWATEVRSRFPLSFDPSLMPAISYRILEPRGNGTVCVSR